MSVKQTRAEILRLIERMNETDRSHARAARQAPRPKADVDHGKRREPPASGHLRARRLELARLAEQRAKLAASVAGTPVNDRIEALEQRLAQMEARLGAGNQIAAAPQPAATGTVPADATFGGMIRETMLGDMLQLVTSQGMSGVFSVSDDQRATLLYFFEGEITHAVGDGTEGEDAVFAAMAVQKGSYFFRETNDIPDNRTINANTQFLILEALRRIDEESAGVTE